MNSQMLGLTIALVACAFFLGLYGRTFPATPDRKRSPFWYPRRSWQFRRTYGDEPDLTDVGEQLRAVMAAPFKRQKLMAYPEYKVFRVIENDIATRPGYRLFAQANLGEVLRSPDVRAYRSINSKRVDMLLVDGGGWPILAIEYQGTGHYQGNAAARDAIKKEALRKAGVKYVEVSASDSDDQIRNRVREQLGWPTTATSRALARVESQGALAASSEH